MLLLPFPFVQINQNSKQQMTQGQSIQSLLNHFTEPQSPGPEHICEFCYKRSYQKEIVFTSSKIFDNYNQKNAILLLQTVMLILEKLITLYDLTIRLI